jgi:hypothetical protein
MMDQDTDDLRRRDWQHKLICVAIVVLGLGAIGATFFCVHRLLTGMADMVP